LSAEPLSRIRKVRFDSAEFEPEYGLDAPYFQASAIAAAGIDRSVRRVEFEVRPRGASNDVITVNGFADLNARGDRFYISGGLPADWPEGEIEARFRAVPRI
jgi:hypothetical protein